MAKYFDNRTHSAPVENPIQNEFLDVGRSRHNLNFQQCFKGVLGLLMPFHIVPAFPNTDVKVAYEMLIEVANPLKRKLFNSVSAYVHTFKVYFADTWEGYYTHIQHGQNGDIQLAAPRLSKDFTFVDLSSGNKSTVDTFSLYAPSSYMGLGASRVDKSTRVSNQDFLSNNICFQAKSQSVAQSGAFRDKQLDSVDVVRYPSDFCLNALYFVGFQQIFRSRYLNHNLVGKNKFWFPDDVMHFLLPYESGGKYVVYLRYLESGFTEPDPEFGLGNISQYQRNIDDVVNPNSHFYVPSDEFSGDFSDYSQLPFLNAPRFRQFKGDYFVSSSPFANLMRGSLDSFNIEGLIAKIDWSKVVGSSTSALSNFKAVAVGNTDVPVGSQSAGHYLSDQATDFGADNRRLREALNRAFVNLDQVFTLNLFRSITAYSLFLERNANTDGSYNEVVKAQFGVSPKANQHEPFYVGGISVPVLSSEVLQSSQSTDDSPLGSSAGRMFGSGSGYVGSTHFEDFGFLMSVMSIVPDSMYTSGVESFLSKVSPDDVYFPLLNNLGADAIKNFELFVGNNSNVNNDIFAWKLRFDEYRSRRNVAKTNFMLPHDLDDVSASRVMTRRFSTTPRFNNGFVTMSPSNVDMDVFSNKFEAPFDISVGCRCDWVGPLPAEAHPADFGFFR